MSYTESFGFMQAAIMLMVFGFAMQAGKSSAQEKEPLPQVLLKTSKGDVLIELFEDEAPNTVANFINLVEKKYYDGITFHRVIEDFMAQGGDPTGTGAGGPGHVIDCEVDHPNRHPHKRGSLSMAHRGKNTGGSQFFICFRATTHLDGLHTVFGQVVQGMENVDKFQTRDPRVGGPSDKIITATVVRKRDHDYKPKTNPGN